MIASLFEDNPNISRHINPMISTLLEKNTPTYFHRMILLYHQYMDDAYVKEQNYKNLKSFYSKDTSKEERSICLLGTTAGSARLEPLGPWACRPEGNHNFINFLLFWIIATCWGY